MLQQDFKITPNANIPVGSQEFYCGVEYEIESIKGIGNAEDYFSVVEDHSLRNNGREFKTQPQTFEAALLSFKQLHKELILGKDPFSERTSIHVHVNVMYLETEQVRQFVLLYALLEPLFLDFVGKERANSIFCVPLNYTFMPNFYKFPLMKMVEKWHKYTAFNIRPLLNSPEVHAFGTIEFRHLYGTNKYEVFHTWLSTLKDLYTFIKDNPTFNIIKQLEAGVTVDHLAAQAIPLLAKNYTKKATQDMCQDTLLDVKLAVGGLSPVRDKTLPEKKKVYPAAPAEAWGQVVVEEVQF